MNSYQDSFSLSPDIHKLPRLSFVLIRFLVANCLDIGNRQNTSDLRSTFAFLPLVAPGHFRHSSGEPMKPVKEVKAIEMKMA